MDLTYELNESGNTATDQNHRKSSEGQEFSISNVEANKEQASRTVVPSTYTESYIRICSS